MPLTSQEKEDLEHAVEVQALVDEPEGVLAMVARLARRKADAPPGSMTPDERKRWAIVANALLKAEAEVNAYHSPERQKLEQPMAEWAPPTPEEPKP